MTPAQYYTRIADAMDADPYGTDHTAAAADALRDAAHRLTDIETALHILTRNAGLIIRLDATTSRAADRIAALARGDA